MLNFWFWKKTTEKGALNLLGWSKTHKIEIHLPYYLEPEIHPIRILPEPEYTWPVFNSPAWTDNSNYNSL